MTRLPPELAGFDWSVTTWEGSRREQMRRWAALPLADALRAVEEMDDLAERLRARGADPRRQGARE